MSATRIAIASLAALAPFALAVAGQAEGLEHVSFVAWVALAWIAVASVPGAATGSASDAACASAALASPLLALGFVADARSGTSYELGLARAAVALASIAALHSIAQGSGARAPLRFGAWCALVAFAPALELALRLGAGTHAPAAVEAWSSFSPLRWAVSELALATDRTALQVVASAWRPALAIALLATVLLRRASPPERAE